MILVIFLVFVGCLAELKCDRFDERLLIKPLPSGHVFTFFQFTVQTEINSASEQLSQHFHLFPRSLGEVLSECEVHELHFSLTQGLWRHENWGLSPRSAPPGAELWAFFKGDANNVSDHWARLSEALSGQFCASLNFIAGANTVTPMMSFRPSGVMPPGMSFNQTLLRYSSLPPEIVCTENLTPFRKLLPCGAMAGLSTLLNALNLFGAPYVSLAVDVQAVCKDSCSKVVLELVQTVSVVFDPPVQQNGKQDWSFVKLFGSPLSSTCPLATTSEVYVDISSNKSGSEFQLNLEPSETVHEEKPGEGQSLEEKTFAVFDLKDILEKSRFVNIGATYKKAHIYGIIRPPVLHADRKITGFGQEQGGIHCTFYNHHSKRSLKIVYLDVIPWYLRLYTHTLTIKHGSKEIKPDHMHYEPARDRSRPHHLELMLTLPPKSVVELSVEYDLAFLKWTEYPPDANHGFYVGSAVISSILDTNRNISYFPSSTSSSAEGHFVRIHTQILLVSLPTPDFSMPYNVICLTCTVVALAFGPIHNITTKVLHPVDEQKKESMFSKVKTKVRTLWGSKPLDTVSKTSDAPDTTR